jgi:hypothetical protein
MSSEPLAKKTSTEEPSSYSFGESHRSAPRRRLVKSGSSRKHGGSRRLQKDGWERRNGRFLDKWLVSYNLVTLYPLGYLALAPFTQVNRF